MALTLNLGDALKEVRQTHNINSEAGQFVLAKAREGVRSAETYCLSNIEFFAQLPSDVQASIALAEYNANPNGFAAFAQKLGINPETVAKDFEALAAEQAAEAKVDVPSAGAVSQADRSAAQAQAVAQRRKQETEAREAKQSYETRREEVAKMGAYEREEYLAPMREAAAKHIAAGGTYIASREERKKLKEGGDYDARMLHALVYLEYRKQRNNPEWQAKQSVAEARDPDRVRAQMVALKFAMTSGEMVPVAMHSQPAPRPAAARLG